MDLAGLTLYSGSDSANNYHANYVNNCRVVYLKYFAGAVCTDAEID
jgi:hypothetical protein